MTHIPELLVNISVALGAAFVGGLIARRLGLPAILGYLLAGIAIGPFTPGFAGDTQTILDLAELGVIFLMFGVGLHFSFADLWRVRSIAVPGAIGQLLLATLIGFVLSQYWGLSVSSSIVIGLAISIASTVVLLRNLMDRNLLNTHSGQVAVGWLVMEDLATILILILMPALAVQSGRFEWSQLFFTLFKAGIFVALMFLVGKHFFPWLLNLIAHTRSRELFILAVLFISLGTALGAAELFGVSLALGAFAAGAIVSESPQSYQVGADVLPFQEAFAVVFFVSVGMLVNPSFLFANLGKVVALTLLVVFGKAIITLGLGTLIRGPATAFLVVAAGLSQIGEFSFIVGQAGLQLGLLSSNNYSLILAAALVSITVNPALFSAITPVEKWLRGIPWFWKRLDQQPVVEHPVELKEDAAPVVVVGYGRVGKHLLRVLKRLDIPVLIIESDAEVVGELNEMGIPTIYGDAANSEVLLHAGLKKAKAMVVTLPEEAATEIIVATAHRANPALPIIARAATAENIEQLARLGAKHVIQPELEGGLEMVSHTLLELGLPRREVDTYAAEVRNKHYEFEEGRRAHLLMRNLLRAADEMEITWYEVGKNNWIAGRSLAESDLRGRTGASVVAIIRDGKLIPNPKSTTVFTAGDRIGAIGEEGQLEALQEMLDKAGAGSKARK
ncbi:MAG: cation:proton antiporter [Anaerolineales bacterium]|nr:cation:proton antiporter [Anaerolineales bacterium]